MKRKVTFRYETVILTDVRPRAVTLEDDEELVSLEQSSEMTQDGPRRYAHIVVAKTEVM